MLETLVDLSTQILDVFPFLFDIVASPVYDLLYDLVESFGINPYYVTTLFDLIDSSDLGLILSGIGINVYDVSFLVFIVGIMPFVIIPLGIILFVLDVIYRIIPG